MAARVIAPYDPRWPVLFDELEALLRSAIGDEVISIDHVGSTAVPGLAAKDVIDIQVTVGSLDCSAAWPNQIGPFHRRHGVVQDHLPPGEAAGRGWEKRYWSSRDPAAHLHVREQGRPNQRYALLFRDFLRAEPRAARAYERAKRQLSSICQDKDIYSDAKDPICDLVMCHAETWATQTGWKSGT